MVKSDHPPVLAADLALNRVLKLARENRFPLLCSWIVGMMAHMFAFTNKLINHDEVQCLFNKGGTVTSGRWGLGALDAIFPNYSMPWIYGILTILFLSIAVCLLVNLLSLRSRFLQGLAAGLILSFPSLTGTFGYMFTSSSYGFSFLLAVVAVWCVSRQKLLWWISGFGCMVLSLSIYQSYISVSASLLVLLLICQLLQDEEPGIVLKNGILYLAFLVTALIGYYAATQIVFAITGTGFGSYASGGLTLSVSSVFQGVGLAYSSFWKFFAENYLGLIPTNFSRLLHGGCLAAALALLAGNLLRRDWRRSLFLFVLTAVFPLAINCMYMISAPESIHTLVIYSFVSVYLFFLLLVQCSLDKPSFRAETFFRNVLPVLASIIVIVNIYIANQAYLNLHLRYENAYSFYTSLISDLRSDPGFTPDTKLAVIGRYQDPEHFIENFEHTDRITGVHGFIPDSYSADQFIRYYIGLDIPFASSQEIAEIQQSDAFQKMPSYPYYGSTCRIGDILVVRLS